MWIQCRSMRKYEELFTWQFVAQFEGNVFIDQFVGTKSVMIAVGELFIWQTVNFDFLWPVSLVVSF